MGDRERRCSLPDTAFLTLRTWVLVANAVTSLRCFFLDNFDLAAGEHSDEAETGTAEGDSLMSSAEVPVTDSCTADGLLFTAPASTV